MLRIIILGEETFNEETQEFGSLPEVVLDLEHSLYSVSKWESIYQRPFLTTEEKTPEEILDYLKAMVLRSDVDPEAFGRLSQDNVDAIQAYIDSQQSGTTFGEIYPQRGPGEIISAELVYYWMVSFNIPFECQHWHLNRLFALLKICNIKNSDAPTMSLNDLATRNRELNAQRRAELGTRG